MTENVSRRFVDFDQWPMQDAIEAMYDGQLFALTAIRPALPIIAAAAKAAAERLGKTGRLIYVGAGTSGRLGVLDGAELGPTYSWPVERTLFCIAGGLGALTVSAEGAEDSAEDGAAEMETAKAGKNDIVFCIAASGKTPYTLGALRAAKARGALTIGISNNADTPILTDADFGILAETGSELVAGSTRMKAGTTQKVILNMLSTAIMTSLGRVYKGLMVDMIVSNAKLQGRAEDMVCKIADCTPETAVKALGTADNHIKLAVLIALGESAQTGREILARHFDNLRSAVDEVTTGA